MLFFLKEFWVYKSFVCLALLEFKPITYFGNCDIVLLEDSKIEEEKEDELNTIQCDTCAAWFHYKCEKITTEHTQMNGTAPNV